MRAVARPSRRCIALALALMAALAAGGALSGCADGGAGAARARYNQALQDFEAGRWEEAAEGFLAARDRAGMDPALRFRAAYNLGLSHARRADELGAAPAGEGEAGPEAIIHSLRQSAAWFRDAVRLDPDSEDARVNLEVVLRRIQVLADQLNKGQNSLEARLERVIEDQRALRDQIRGLMQRVAESGAAAEPVAFQGEFDALATFERRLLADTGTVSDLAGEELGLLQGKDERGQEEEMRLVQLQNLDIYLQAARGELADTRRLLRRLLGDKAHGRAVAGLAALERAREQLLDPVTVLRGIAQDQAQVLGQTAGLDQLGEGGVQLGAGDEAAQDAPPAPPVWLTAEHLQGRQDVLRQRTDEVLARFQAGVSAAGDPAAQPDAPADPRQQRVLAQAAEAIPSLEQAVAHMQGAASALAGEDLTRAAEAQTDAIEALFRAMERFSDIRALIELIHREHMATSALLTPSDAPEAVALPPEIAGLSTAERSARIRALVTRNTDRLSRLEGLLDDELAVLDAQAADAGAGGAGAAQPGPQAEQMSPEQIDAAKQQYLQAQGLRAQADEALARLAEAMGEGSALRIDGARAAAGEAAEHIEDLRRLFFSIVEHLKELLQSQTRTHDQTGSAAAGPDEELSGRLGQLVEPQSEHAATGDALAQALAAQADAAAQQPQQPGSGADASERLAQAAGEVTQATAEMQSAADFLRKDAEAARSMSVDIGPTLEAQQVAMEHLENAIRLLQPPQEQQQDQQDQQQQDQQQDQQQQQQQAQEMSQQQAQRRLQEIRDREAERQRDKRRRERFTPEPVEKDW